MGQSSVQQILWFRFMFLLYLSIEYSYRTELGTADTPVQVHVLIVFKYRVQL